MLPIITGSIKPACCSQIAIFNAQSGCCGSVKFLAYPEPMVVYSSPSDLWLSLQKARLNGWHVSCLTFTQGNSRSTDIDPRVRLDTVLGLDLIRLDRIYHVCNCVHHQVSS